MSTSPNQPLSHAAVAEYSGWARDAVLPIINGWVTEHARGHPLYELMLDYPLRPAKGLRPALCLATCRALGGDEDAVLPTASALELLHNAFLIHDDVEDGSLERRGRPTMAREHGAAIAINVADGMLGLALVPLLHNTEVLGLGAALAVLERVVDLVRVTVEGQALELEWIRTNVCPFPESNYRAAYERLVRAKTAEYSFVAPVELGALVAGASSQAMEQLGRFAEHLGIAFQITDDLLNLDLEAERYGKERNGDLWEGKRTLMLLHALNAASDEERQRAEAALSRRRPRETPDLGSVIECLQARGEVTERGRIELLSALIGADAKTAHDVDLLEALIVRHESIPFARAVAREHADRAAAIFGACDADLAPGRDREFLDGLLTYVVERLR